MPKHGEAERTHTPREVRANINSQRERPPHTNGTEQKAKTSQKEKRRRPFCGRMNARKGSGGGFLYTIQHIKRERQIDFKFVTKMCQLNFANFVRYFKRY